MPNIKENTAYDLSLFEAKTKVTALAPNKKQQQAMQHHARLQAITRIVSIFIVTALVLGATAMLIISRVRLTEMNDTLVEWNEKLAILESENIRLSGELSSKVSAESLESYALAHGMQKIEPHQIVYFAVEEGDRIEVPTDADPGIWDSLCQTVASWFS